MANGGFIGKRQVPIITRAKGVWTANELYNARLDGIWPLLIAEVSTDFLIIGGGGGGGVQGNPSAMSGGGAGGYLNSYGSEASGGNSTSLSTLTLEIFTNYAVTIGAGGAINTNGSNTSLTGTDVNGASVSLTAIGGGRGGGSSNTNASIGGGNDGGSGGGGGDATPTGQWFPGVWDPGLGTSNQGFAGGASKSEPDNVRFCQLLGSAWCGFGICSGGGGGGAGSVGTAADSGGAGGSGLASSITGSSVTRAAGGSGRGSNNPNSAAMPTGSGSSSPGGGGEGGQTNNDGGDGIIILRYPSVFALSNPGGGLTFSSATEGSDKVSSITAGTGNIQFVAA
jgi:hypothetical protein